MAGTLESGTTGGGRKDPLSWLFQEPAPSALLNEEGEEGEEDSGEEDGDSEEADDAGEEGGGDSGSDSSPAEEPKKPFENLELKEAFCWGWCTRAAELCWANIADASITKGWRNSDVKRLDVDLKKNVDACYFFICQGTFEDLDTGFRWRAAFVNDHALWKLELSEGQAEVLPEDAKAFFSCEYFKKFSKRCGDLIDRARKIYLDVVDPHLKNGELMSVDPVKMERLVHDSGVSQFMDNLRNSKYELQ